VGSVVPLGDANDCGLAAKFDIEQGLLDAGMTAAKALERAFACYRIFVRPMRTVAASSIQTRSKNRCWTGNASPGGFFCPRILFH